MIQIKLFKLNTQAVGNPSGYRMLKQSAFFHFFLAVAAFFHYSCAHSTAQSIDSLGTFQTVKDVLLPTIPSDEFFLTVSEQDYLGSNVAGLRWTPAIIALKNDIYLYEREMLAGYFSSATSTFVPPPIEGSCVDTLEQRDLSQSATPPLKRTVDINTPLPANAEHKGSLFFVKEENSTTILAVGALNEMGQAVCVLPDTSFVISTGYGRLRQETIVEQGAKSVTISSRRRGFLVLDADARNEGKILRIGRSPVFENLGLDFKIPSSFQGDLFKQATNESFGVSEYLFTSVLLNNKKLKIYLEPESYTIALIGSKPGDTCFADISIESGKYKKLECTAQTTQTHLGLSGSEKLNASLEKTSLTLDATNMPTGFLQNHSYRKWLESRGENFFLLQREADVYLHPTQIKELLNYPANSYLGPYSARDRTVDLSNNVPHIRGVVRVLESVPRPSPPHLEEHFLPKAHRDTVFVAGIGERGFLDGTVPFSYKTMVYARGLPLNLNTKNIVATNGTVIEWQEPALNVHDVVQQTSNQQRYRAKVIIPPYNQTEFIELYVNGTLFKRYVVPRENVRAFQEFYIDERIDKNIDFEISIMAFGQIFLPEFLYGTDNTPPVALTRPICIDVNENGRCDVSTQ